MCDIALSFENTQVLFTKDAFVNATQIAKHFNKKPADYLRLDQTKEYITELSKSGNPAFEYNQLVIVKKGSAVNGGGTWLHPKLTIDFARWLSAKVAIWCDTQIEQILHPECQPAIPEKVEPITLYDLDYIEDLRNDEKTNRNVNWWTFERVGGENNMAGSGSGEQGEEFFKQTQPLAQINPLDAVSAIKHSLLKIIGGSIEGYGFYGCESIFCENIARATVAWMVSSEKDATPPDFKKEARKKK